MFSAESVLRYVYVDLNSYYTATKIKPKTYFSEMYLKLSSSLTLQHTISVMYTAQMFSKRASHVVFLIWPFM